MLTKTLLFVAAAAVAVAQENPADACAKDFAKATSYAACVTRFSAYYTASVKPTCSSDACDCTSYLGNSACYSSYCAQDTMALSGYASLASSVCPTGATLPPFFVTSDVSFTPVSTAFAGQATSTAKPGAAAPLNVAGALAAAAGAAVGALAILL